MRRLTPLAIALVSCAVVASSLPSSVATSARAPQQVVGVAAERAGGASQHTATFNVPRPWGSKHQQNLILLDVERAINQVPRPTKNYPEPTITIASYLLDRTTSVTALINACKRGVGVRVVLDDDIVNKNSRRLISALNGDNVRDKNHDGKADSKPRTGRCGRNTRKPTSGKWDHKGRVVADDTLLSRRQAKLSLDVPTGRSVTWGRDGSYVKRCDGSCRNAGSGGNMHSKFYLFSRTGKDRNVVMVSSSNLNRGGAKAGWNDMYVMRNRPRSYEAYLKVHRAMTRQLRSAKRREEIVDGPFTSRFFPMRRASKKTDPTLRDLKQIRCTSGLGRTEVYVSMFYWKGVRGNYLADQLLTLAHHGCKVSAIYGAPSRQIAQRLRTAAGRHVINLFDSRWDFNEDGYNEVRTHAKYVLVKGTYRGNHRAYVVMTGTQNWVAGSLRLGDENSLNVALRSAYKSYKRDWDNIRNHSRRLPYSG